MHLGFTPMEAIQSMTRFGGDAMDLPGELGVVAEGALADLLIVDGDPPVLMDQNRLRAIKSPAS